MYRRLSFAATVSGVFLQLAGLALDAALHARDATLAAREGPFSLSNPGHLVFAIGLALAVLGVSTALPRGMTVAITSVLSAITLLTLAVGALALVGDGFTGHSHSGDQAHREAEGSGTRHTSGIEISWERLHEIDRMLATTKAATGEYRDVEHARADGYRQVMGALHGTGAHFVNQRYLDEGGFDVAHPEALLYDRADDGGLELVGVAFMLPRRPDDETPTHFGPLAIWHDHDFHRPCLTTRTWGHPVTVHSTEADCRASDNVFIPPKFWMLHVWLFRASPEGIFSHDNDTIEGPPDVSVNGEVE